MSSAAVFLEEYDTVDFHSHILPGVDHGSDDLKTSLLQLEIAKKNSVNRIVATSHFYPAQHSVDSFLELRDRAARELIAAAGSDLPEIKLGAEVLICDRLERLPGVHKLCFPGTDYIMVELPFFDFTESMATTIEALAEQGLNVILAHADRYPKHVIEYLLDCGVKTLQINVDSLAAFFKKKHLCRWLEKGFVGMVGSDIHGVDKNAYHKFALAKKRVKKVLPYIKKNSDKIWDKIESI